MALITALVNVLKAVGVVKDGQAPAWSLGLQTVGFGLLVYTRIFYPEFDVAGVDGTAATIAQILVLLTGLFVQLGGPRLMHAGLRGWPVIGTSHSARVGAA